MKRKRRIRTAIGSLAWTCALLAGCRAPAARFQAPEGHTPSSCSYLFARQIVEDSTVEITCRPWQSGLTLVAEPAKDLWVMSKGAFGKRVMLSLTPGPEPLPVERAPLDTVALEKELDDLVGGPIRPALVRMHPDGEEAIRGLKQVIDSAEHCIDVMMFQWENDSLGAAIAEHLASRAGPNLRVRILVDGGGNLIFGRPVHAHPADVNGVVSLLAQKPYVEVIRTRNPFGRVDHRKLVVADRRLAWTGGRNFTDISFFKQHDISFTVEGPLVADMQKCFDEYWVDQGGTAQAPSLALRANDMAPLLALRAHDAFNAKARLVCTEPMNHEIEQMLYHVVDSAKHHVYIENYTFCDGLLIYKLAQARRRGVDVRVVLSFSDCTETLNRANRVITNRLLAEGVRVYVFPGMTHVKAASVDGCWAYVGTGNFDPLSLRRNLEMGLAIAASPLVEELERDLFLPDFRPEWEPKEPLPVTIGDYLCELAAGFCL